MADAWRAARGAPGRIARTMRPAARGIVANVVSLAGVGTAVAGVATWSLGAALVLAGVALMVVGQGIER